MKKIHKKMLVQLLFGFLIGRVVLLERNPAGAAFFAGALVQSGGVVPLVFSVLRYRWKRSFVTESVCLGLLLPKISWNGRG